MSKILRVLFVCVHNAARSQMAEAFLNRLGEGRFLAESAGFEPDRINPVVIESMADIGYDLSGNTVDSVFDFFRQGRNYDVVIKVCDEAHGQKCPIFPSIAMTLSWSFTDPASLTGSENEIREQVDQIRDQIKTRVEEFIRVFET
mgnify:CR=1 FL=1